MTDRLDTHYSDPDVGDQGGASQHRDAAEPMDDLAKALDVDLEAMRKDNPAAVRDMEIACCQCLELARCEKAIADGVVGDTFRSFCPNADEFDRAARGERL